MTASTQTYRDPNGWPEPAPPNEGPRNTARIVIGTVLVLFAVMVLCLIAVGFTTTTPPTEPKTDAQQYVELQNCIDRYSYAHCLNKFAPRGD